MKKNLIMTGTSSDMGMAFLSKYGAGYHNIYAHYRGHHAGLLALKEEKKLPITFLKADFLKEEELFSMVQTLETLEKGVYDLVHIAAEKATPQKFLKTDWDSYQAMWDTQIRSFYAILKATLRKFEPGSGVVVLLTEYVKGVPPKYLSDYVTAKYALMGLTKSMASEFGPKGIRFNMLSPTMADTKFVAHLSHLVKEEMIEQIPAGRLATTADIAQGMAFLLSPEAAMIQGNNLLLTGGKLF